MSQETLLQENARTAMSDAKADRPVGFWALVPVVALLFVLFLNVFSKPINSVIEYLMGDVLRIPYILYDTFGIMFSEFWTIPYVTRALTCCVYVASAAFVFAKMSRGGNKIGTVCICAWAGLEVVNYIFGIYSVISLVFFQAASGMVLNAITGVIAYLSIFLLIAFLVMRLLKTSVYKIPLIVGLAGTVLELVYRLLNNLFATNVRVMYKGNLLLMAVAFLLIFLASRKLKQKPDGVSC